MDTHTCTWIYTQIRVYMYFVHFSYLLKKNLLAIFPPVGFLGHCVHFSCWSMLIKLPFRKVILINSYLPAPGVMQKALSSIPAFILDTKCPQSLSFPIWKLTKDLLLLLLQPVWLLLRLTILHILFGHQYFFFYKLLTYIPCPFFVLECLSTCLSTYISL